MADPIPLLNLQTEVELLWEPLLQAVQGVFRSGQFIAGPNVAAFETEVAAYLGVRHAVGVNSGTDALVIALRAAGVQPGDEVITTPFTFFATAEAISLVGATPVFADIAAATYTLDPAQAASAITARTRAILPVHLYGQAAPMEPLLALAEAHRLAVVEDTAQAFGGAYRGRRLGTLGTAGALSFFPSKNLGGFGDGGLIATDDDRIAAEARMLRTHGSQIKYRNERVGYNSRLDELQAACLRVKLPLVDQWNQQRRAAAARYAELLRDISGLLLPVEADGTYHVFHQYTVRLPAGSRDQVQRVLTADGIGSAVYYPVPLHRLPVYAHRPCRLPVAEAAAEELLSLPMGPFLTPRDQERVARVLRTALR